MNESSFFFAFLITIITTAPFKKYLHSNSTGARCLDGSQAAVFVSQGSLNDTLIFFTGGGYCEGHSLSQTLESCYQRSKTELGSSINYPDEYDLDTYGILSSNQQVNPNFWNWTKAFVPYCDGSLHQGSRISPISYKDKSLYFRGSNNTLATFEYLNKKIGLYLANRIIITGQSAGATATFLWSNYLYDKSVHKNVFAIPDSGLFLNKYLSPKTNKSSVYETFTMLFRLVNNQTSIPLSQCVAQLGNNLNCLQFGELVRFFKAPMFIIQSQYDAFAIQMILSLKCLTQQNQNGAVSMQNCNQTEIGYINDYRNTWMKALKNFTLYKKNTGIWAPSCVQHTFCHYSGAFHSNSYKIPNQVGITISQSISNFINNPDSLFNIHFDVVDWPNNIGCSNFNSSHKKLLRFEFQ